MIRNKKDMPVVERTNIKGGSGTIAQLHLLEAEDMQGYARHCVVMSLNPGDSIGPHDHPEEAEFFYVMDGQLVTLCDGEEVLLNEGDVSFTTGEGNKHMLKNDSSKPAKVLAIVMTK